MAGLEIEASENVDFMGILDEAQVRHALRYITWELNGFPGWLEKMHQAFPDLVEEAVAKELFWELNNTESDKSMHYILHDLVYYAPWLHRPISPLVVAWVKANPSKVNVNRNYCLHIIVNGGTSTDKLTEIATQQIELTNDLKSISYWYALFVDCEPDIGIPEFEMWLSGLEVGIATNVAQIFIITLLGGRYSNESWPSCGKFKEAEYLKSLYVLTIDDFDDKDCDEFIAAKEKLWTDHGFGPWAFVVDGHFVGWGGLQPENGEADLGLVLHPKFWGIGKVLYDEIIERAFGKIGFGSVTALLPPTRKLIKGLLRLGFKADGELEVGGERFNRYRLDKQVWEELHGD